MNINTNMPNTQKIEEWEKKLLEGNFFDYDTYDYEKNSLSEFETRMVEKLTDFILPRHMQYFDWNLPFAQASIIVLRPFIQELISQAQSATRKEIVEKIEEREKIIGTIIENADTKIMNNECNEFFTKEEAGQIIEENVPILEELQKLISSLKVEEDNIT